MDPERIAAPAAQHRPIADQAAAQVTVQEHACLYCPTCSARLREHRCKLICTQCGYYLSCADYY